MSIDFLERQSPTANGAPKVHRALSKGDVFPLHSDCWWEVYVVFKEGNEFLDFSHDQGVF